MRLGRSRTLFPVAALVVVGVALLAYGSTMLSGSLNAQSTKSETETGGMLLGWSNPTATQNHTVVSSIQNIWAQMRVDVARREIVIELDFQSRFSRSHSFAMILPFQLRSLEVLQNATIDGTVDSAVSENLTGSSSVVTCTWGDLHNYSDWESAAVGITGKVTGNLVSSQKGEDELYLPIEIYPSSDIVQGAKGFSPTGVSFPGSSSDFAINFTQIGVVLPASSKLEQLIPSYADIEKTTASTLINFYSLFGTSSVTVDYQDVGLAAAYSNDLFMGAVLTSSGFVLAVAGVGVATYTRRRKEGPDLVELTESPRRLASVMFMDIVGYSGITHKDEGVALDRLREQRDLVRPFLQKHTGREIKTIGDGVLVEFASTLEAVTCACEIQNALHESNSSRPLENRLLMRIGIHLGDVLHTRNDVFGDAVNVASRVEPLAPPGGVAFTRQVYEEVKNKVKFPILGLGPQKLKNIGEGYEIYRVVFPWESEEAK